MNKCAIFLAEGFEECEALITVDMIRRTDVGIDMISLSDSYEVTSSHNITVKADYLLDEVSLEDYDALILPGGKLGTENLEKCEVLKNALVKHYEENKLVCAICAAPSIFGHLGFLKDKNYTCFPSFDDDYKGTYQKVFAVCDGNVITGRGMGATIEFAKEILLKYKSEEEVEELLESIQYR